MKKRSKRFLTMALAAAMSCSMITGWANTAEIVSITVTDSANNVETVASGADFEVNPSDLVTVKVKIKDDSAAAIKEAEATFLTALTDAFGEGQTLSDTNIQYVDQQTTACDKTTDAETGEEVETGDAYATFTFRPRMKTEDEVTSLKLTGAHTAKVGGTAVATVEDFTYTVKEADVVLTLTADTNNANVGDTVTFTVSVPEGKTLPSTVTVKGIGEDYTATLTNGTFTWTAVEGTYNVSVSAGEGYDDSTAVAIAVSEPAVDIPAVDDGKVEDAKDALDKIEIESAPAVTDGTAEVILNTAATAGEQTVRYTVTGGSDAVTYDAATGKITYTQKTDGKFAERVKVVAQVGTEEQDITKVSYVYFVPGDISFGNVTVVASGNDDAFATAEGVAAASDADKLEARTAALNIVLGKAGMDSIAAADKTLDWNGNGSIALSEYNIMRHMIKGTEGYTPEIIKEIRSN